MLHKLLISLFVICSVSAYSQTNNLVYGEEDDSFPKILEINPLNEQFLINQRKRVEEITRKNFGQSLKMGEANFPLLQRIIDEELIDEKETLDLQALGVILGDALADSHKKLHWKVYHDELGKSLAVCVQDTKECIFPVTMLSKRIEQGLKPNVSEMYQKGLDAMKPFLPKLPFSS